MSNELDLELRDKALAGSEKSFEMLINKHSSKIKRQIACKVSDEFDRDDVYQDVIISTWKYLKTFKGNSAFSTWLYAVTKSKIQKHFTSKSYRNSSKTSSLSDIPQVKEEVTNETPDKIAVYNATFKRYIQSVENLPSSMKEIYNLREKKNMTYYEISEATNSKIGTVRSRLHRARKLIAYDMGVNYPPII